MLTIPVAKVPETKNKEIKAKWYVCRVQLTRQNGKN
jgi:hypothetical protein